ncbi:hypothetical protein QJS04_geneDACA021749 [Acorus gramineus]|uniref:Uncharacterized protein n=1 Tax=Acorus gramineus TaxID=55184 RepID=A0AAV9AFE4_ACOGR|nr:hypothetical protein QJS04_geneDACA021749 [Acorus gramineus]
MKTYDVDGSTLSLSLFSDVTNCKELLDSMQTGTLEPEVAFLNASLVSFFFLSIFYDNFFFDNLLTIKSALLA